MPFLKVSTERGEDQIAVLTPIPRGALLSAFLSQPPRIAKCPDPLARSGNWSASEIKPKLATVNLG
jgi:hypothetical protein